MPEPYAELHARSAFSFLQGASVPEDLVSACADLGIPAMALLDRDGVYGAPRFHMAAKKTGMRAHIGSEITCTNGKRYPLLCENREGYQNLCRLVTRMKLRAKKGEGAATLEEIAEFARADLHHRRISTKRWPDIFGKRNLYAELQRHMDRARGSPQPGHRRKGAPHGHSAGGHQRRLLRQSGAAGGAGRAHLRARKSDARKMPAGCWHRNCGALSEIAGREMARLFADLPEAIANTRRFPRAWSSRWRIWATNFRAIPVPDGETMASFLRKRADEGARRRYRPYHERRGSRSSANWR